MKKLSFLFLGGAKRVGIGRLFKKAAADLGYEAEIVGYELDRACPLAAIATDIVEGLRWSDTGIFAHIDDTVTRLGIDIIMPFVDSAVGVAAEYAARYPHRKVFVPAPCRKLADKMFDKVAAAELFEQKGLPIPPTYHAGDPCLRLIAKPRFGSASKGIVEINSLQKLYEFQGREDKYLIQERIDNREEITVDCYAEVTTGRIVGVSPRIRLETAGGEAVRTVTVDSPQASALARRAIEETGLRGAVTVQIIHDFDNDRYMIMEINPRLGGGAVASVYAGFNLPAAIIQDALGERPVAAGAAQAGVLTTRFLDDVVFRPND